MNPMKLIQAEDFEKILIKIHEPFSEYLEGDPREHDFSISLLDAVRLSGHACPAIVGAFLISQRAVRELFPETNVCERGQVRIDMPGLIDQGATGPISHIFSMIFGAWEQSGFGGLQGQFVRRNLLMYGSNQVPLGLFRFTNIKTNRHIDIRYEPGKAELSPGSENLPFQKVWRERITKIVANPDAFVTCP